MYVLGGVGERSFFYYILCHCKNIQVILKTKSSTMSSFWNNHQKESEWKWNLSFYFLKICRLKKSNGLICSDFKGEQLYGCMFGAGWGEWWWDITPTSKQELAPQGCFFFPFSCCSETWNQSVSALFTKDLSVWWLKTVIYIVMKWYIVYFFMQYMCMN